MANLSAETLREMLSIIREARNDLKKLCDTTSMISSALSKPEELNLKKKAENPLNPEGDESVLLKLPNVCEVVDVRNHQMLARNASGGREMFRNFENPLGNFVEQMVGNKQQEVSVVENPKMERRHDGFGRQALLSTSSVTSLLPKKPPDPPDMIHGKSKPKGIIPLKYSCEEMYERMEMGLCVFCEEVDIPGHNLKHKAVAIVVTEGDDELTVEDTLAESYEPVTETVMKHDSLSKPLECFTSVLQIVDAAGQREHQSESVAQEKMTLYLGEKIKHMMGKQSQKAERIWEPGGLPTEAAQWYWSEKRRSLWFSAATSEKMAERVWEPGGLSAKAAHLDWHETYQNRGGMLKLTSNFHETCVESLVMLLKPGKEIQAGYEWLIPNSVKELAATDIRMRLLWETIKDVTVALFSRCGIKRNFTEYTNWSQQGMQDHAGFNHFLFGKEMFQVKHKWKYKPFPIVSELELHDEAALDTRNEDVLSYYTTGQAREEVISSHAEVRRTIELSQLKAWLFKYKDKRQEKGMNEAQLQALKIKLGQSRYCREVQKLELTLMAGNLGCFNHWFAEVCVDEVFHPQRPPEMLGEKDQQRCYDGFSTKLLSSLRTRMFSTREYCYRINRLSIWFSLLV
ncbi:unnamed protein product [Brassica rapa]|uniref:Uncharacterized protein n=3 Tax=Brassica TaxID=3705 RepID=A0A8D9GMV6_BRACM|nr:unnamed protein product [Brassica napus]CAG7883532.1 unnamed protein product [Brassica rapa]